ncbi:hypothetical protein MTR67_043403, partial [Solanum verrucosum]
DLAGDAWSFGSNYHQSSQSRKMSIGILIDSVSKCRTQKVKQAEHQTHLALVKISSKEIYVDDGTTMAQKTSSKGYFTNDRNKKELASTSAIRNQREPTEKQTSPLISTKTVHHEPTLESGGKTSKVFLQTRTLQFDKSKQAKEDASIERRGKYESKVALEDMPEKEVKGNCPNSLVLEKGAKASKREQKDSGNHVGEPKQNSDTIESDTQSHETLHDASTGSPLMVYGRRGKRKSHHIEEPKEKNDEIVQPDAGNLESVVVEMTEQLRNLQEHIDQHILL